MTQAETRKVFYDSYKAFKNWADEKSETLDEVFGIELARAGCRPPGRLLEVGFGEGYFLDWARVQGFSVVGVEIIDEMAERARGRGHSVFVGTAQSKIDKSSCFDVIVAFDVFEHMTTQELLEFLRFAAQILAPNGKVIARFPNGGSPFGNFYQNGDVTHVTVLSGTRIAQIAHSIGLTAISINNAARPLRGGRQHWIVKRAVYLVRDVIEYLVSRIYYGHHVPFDPNLTVVLGRENG